MRWFVCTIEELESLRSKHIVVQNMKVPSGGFFEVQGIYYSQVDVELTFEVTRLEKSEAFDPSWTTNAQALCGQKRANVRGGAGPFGLHVLASANMEERTSVFFGIFKAQTKYKVLMCHDPTRSTLRPNMYKPTFAGFVDVDIPESGKISRRSLLCSINLLDNGFPCIIILTTLWWKALGQGGTTCITSRVYSNTAIRRNAHLFVFNNGLANVKVSKLEAWEMKRPFMNGA
ncbi:beta-fructofuranosidase, cell wall isozyme-like [Zingiber officinale]|uniref:beta-fructofuranosidase, cell wall isozyme-like n=1 Tax=Zingiber officinale TaxID=94328 RepID=UPI001C4D16F7|nr:beta-fructofuranosidase, cell wall isozyme-like [Zingiber officinale]